MPEISYSPMIISLAVAFVLTVGLGFPAIPLLRRLKAGQSIREDGPAEHLKKAGTPTMGGLFIIAAVVITALIVGGPSRQMFILIFAIVGFGAVGFLDDFIKVVLKRNLGLKEKPKMLLLILFGFLLAVAQLKFGGTGTNIFIPFVNADVDFGIFYIPFIVFVVAAMTNAVNFTAGVDGLASGVTLPVALFLALTSIGSGFGTAGIFAGAVAGACAGFLVHNHKPAKVFMGDTGSLALGGAITAVAVMSNTTMMLPIIGFVYVAEVCSVIIQVFVFRRTGKRVFKMSPLHHHFELSGWSEVKVTLVFTLASVLLCILGALIMR